jgi:hypothetical protein
MISQQNPYKSQLKYIINSPVPNLICFHSSFCCSIETSLKDKKKVEIKNESRERKKQLKLSAKISQLEISENKKTLISINFTQCRRKQFLEENSFCF